MEKTIKRLEVVWPYFVNLLTLCWQGGWEMDRDGRSINLRLYHVDHDDNRELVAKTTLSWWPGNSALWTAHDLWVIPRLRGNWTVKFIRFWQDMILTEMHCEFVFITVRTDNELGMKAAKSSGYREVNLSLPGYTPNGNFDTAGEGHGCVLMVRNGPSHNNWDEFEFVSSRAWAQAFPAYADLVKVGPVQWD